MGSLAQGADGNKRRWNVLVTGFGPFLDNSVNPSYLVAASLPSTLTLPNLPSICIHPYPHPVEVCYDTVRELVPKLLFAPGIPTAQDRPTSLLPLPASSPDTGYGHQDDSHGTPKYDLVLSLGLAPGRKYYSIETCANRDGYVKRDVRGKSLEGDTHWHDTYKAPPALQPSFDMQGLWTRWTQSLPNEGLNLRMSNVAGRYLCEFIFYAVMVEYWRRSPVDNNRHCMFLHVPPGSNQDDIQRGRTVALALIVAMVHDVSSRQDMEDSSDVKADKFGGHGQG